MSEFVKYPSTLLALQYRLGRDQQPQIAVADCINDLETCEPYPRDNTEIAIYELKGFKSCSELLGEHEHRADCSTSLFLEACHRAAHVSA